MAKHVEIRQLQPGDDISIDSEEIESDEEYDDLDSAVEASISDDDESITLKEAGSGSENEEPKDLTGPKDVVYGNFGWADAMSKVLKSGKPAAKKSIILAKAKKDADILKTMELKENPPSFEIDGEIIEKKQDLKQAEQRKESHAEKMLRRQRRKEWDLVGRVLPDITKDRERERILAKIGTRGVVQLFNSVKVQQKTIHERLREAGPLERQKEKALKSFDKTEFLNLLKGQGAKSKVKKEVKEEPSTWSVLRDDFMPEVKMRDWDKQESSDSD